jgi:ribosomal protein S18 acetylase RimI-like enzyme
MTVEVFQADYHNSQHAAFIVLLLDRYASDPMGGGEPLSDAVKQQLITSLSNISHAFSVLATVDEKPAGLINGFECFSTFKCKPLINIHDVTVLAEYRGLGISQKMLDKVEEIARSRDCCKLTLEVLNNNQPALSAYRKFGFSDYELDPEAGTALFWQKKLD